MNFDDSCSSPLMAAQKSAVWQHLLVLETFLEVEQEFTLDQLYESWISTCYQVVYACATAAAW